MAVTEYTEDQLYAMDDDELEKVVAETRAEQGNDMTDNPAPDEDVIEDEITEPEDGAEEEIDDEIADELEQQEADPDEGEINDSDETDDTQEKGDEEAEDDEPIDTEAEDDSLDAEDNKAEAEEAKDEPAISTYKIKANGAELDLTNEELIRLAPKALDYTKKMQEIAPHRKNISIMVDNGISTEDLNLLAAMKEGNIEAFGRMSKIAGIDVLDVDTETSADFVPREYGRSTEQLNIDEVTSTISNDKEYEITQRVVDQQWDDKSREYFRGKPSDLAVLHSDIKEGRHGDINNRAMKLRMLDNGPAKSDVEYYMEAGHQYYADKEAVDMNARAESERVAVDNAAKEKTRADVAIAKAAKVKAKATKDAANSRKNAATTKKVAGTKNVIDYLDDSDEAYDEWYKKLQAKM